MEEWKTYRLEEVCTKITDGSHYSPEGCKEGYLMFSVKDMCESSFNESGAKLISQDDFEKMKANDCVPQKNDVLVAKDGSLLKHIFVCKEEKPVAILSSIAIFRPDCSVILPSFLAYILKSPEVFNYMKNNCVSGSALPRIVLKSFKKVPLSLPPLPLQRRISSLLSSLDAKIETNRRINARLEEMAQALFRSWFIDFTPFKQQEFVEDEFGRRPKGWEVVKINTFVDIQSGFAFKSETFKEDGQFRLLTIKGVQEAQLSTDGAVYIEELPNKMPAYCQLQLGDVLISLTGNVARVCIVDTKNLLLNQRVAKLQPRKSIDKHFIYLLFRNQQFKERVIMLAKGTAQLNLSPIETGNLSTVLPPIEIRRDFDKTISPIFVEIMRRKQEISRLSALRDTLLPKLMSGELIPEEITAL